MLCRIFSPVLLALLLSCDATSLTSRNLDSEADQRAASLAAFDEHVRPALSLCASCHGEPQAPLFMADDTETAHDAALIKVDFDNIDNSRFLKRILEDKHNCNNDECPEIGKKVHAALTKWQEARAATSDGNELGKATQQLALPSRLKTMLYDIGALISNEYKDKIKLSVKVEPKSDTKQYSLVDLTVETEIDVYIKNIKPLVNGKWNSNYAAYKDIDCMVKSNATNSEGQIIHATGSVIAPDNFLATNKLSFSITKIRLGKASDPSCWNDNLSRNMFTNSIKQIIADNCEQAGCHGNDNPNSEAKETDLSNYTIVMGKKMMIGAVITGEYESHKERLSELDEDNKQQILDWLRLNE